MAKKHKPDGPVMKVPVAKGEYIIRYPLRKVTPK